MLAYYVWSIGKCVLSINKCGGTKLMDITC